MKQEIMDLKITNRGKDYFIEQLQKDREALVTERKEYIAQLVNVSRQVGELEAKLMQLAGPKTERELRAEDRSDPGSINPHSISKPAGSVEAVE